jgi:hypothetical protein
MRAAVASPIERSHLTTGNGSVRQLPPPLLQEPRRRQALDIFDSYGIVQVAAGDLQDSDVLPTFTRAPVGYPNCECYTVRDLRNQLAETNSRKELILQFRSKYLN